MGITKLSWYSPANVGASPANEMLLTSCPPTKMFIAPVVLLSGLLGATAPSRIAGDTVPRPVRNTSTVSPRLAGLAALTSEKSACRIAPSPSPFWFNEKTPGAVGASGTSTAFDFVLPTVTTTVAVVPVTPKGTTALICAGFDDTL